MNDPIHLPFCLFLMLVMFLSLVPLKEAKGRRAGEAMVVKVVMLNCCLRGLGVVMTFLASGLCEPN